ncbi:MAG TPA: DUF1292 domain-containing protein [Bacillota bacterium]
MSHETEQDWIVLVDEDGQEYRYTFERVLEMEEKKYVVLVPEIQENPEKEEAHVFRLETDETGEEILVDVEDAELEEVQQLLEAEYEDDADLDEEENGEANQEE